MAGSRSLDQGITRFELREYRKITIRCPKLGDSMVQAQRCDPGIMNPRPANACGDGELAQFFEVTRALGQEVQ